LGRKQAGILVDRPRTQLLRIEDFISGMVDSLWLCEENVFLINSREYPLIKELVRRIFKVGTYDLPALVSDWKQWGNALLHTVSETNTIGPLEAPRYNNIFKLLDSIGYIRKSWNKVIVLCSFYGIRNYSSVCVNALKVQKNTCQQNDLMLQMLV